MTVTFTALSDPTRQRVLARLGRGEATISELAEPRTMSLPAFTKHIGVLVDAGLVTRRKVGRSVVCRLAPGPLVDAEAWLTDLTHFWTITLDRLEKTVTSGETLPHPTVPSDPMTPTDPMTPNDPEERP